MFIFLLHLVTVVGRLQGFSTPRRSLSRVVFACECACAARVGFRSAESVSRQNNIVAKYSCFIAHVLYHYTFLSPSFFIITPNTLFSARPHRPYVHPGCSWKLNKTRSSFVSPCTPCLRASGRPPCERVMICNRQTSGNAEYDYESTVRGDNYTIHSRVGNGR